MVIFKQPNSQPEKLPALQTIAANNLCAEGNGGGVVKEGKGEQI